MKRFNELTNSQKEEAIQYALVQLKDAISEGFIHFGKAQSDEQLLGYAEAAAEEAFYAESEDKIVWEIA
jgi:hypothetical protein